MKLVGKWYYFEEITEQPMTAEQAEKTQLEKYRMHPAGYGFNDFKSIKNEETNKYVNTWKCFYSCE